MHQQTPSPSPNPNPNPNPSWCSEKRHPNSIYPIGSEVEVTHNEDGFRGGWFLATVLNPPPFLLHPSQHFLLHKIFVEYKHLLNRNGSGPLRAFVDLSNVRPKPPPYHSNNHHHHNYKESDVVDAFFDDGWWTGVINEVVVFPDQSKQFLVFFDYPPRSMHFSHSDLRLHMFSVDGKWFLSSNNSIHRNLNPPQDSNNLVDLTGDDDSDLKDDIFSQVPSEISYFSSSHLVSDNKVSNNLIDLTGLDDSRLHDRDGELNFTSGAHVEVNFDLIDSQDSFDSQDVWVPATFIKRSSHGFFVVKYYCSGERKPVKVIVNSLHIRPKPPPSSRKSFNLLEKVDAFYDSRWLSGVVTKVLPEARYIIYCKSTKNEKEVHHKDVRPHLEWADGMWVPSSSSQDLLPSPNHEKLDLALFSNGYKNVHVSPEPTGIIKDNVGEQTFPSSITLKSCQRGTQNVNCDGTMPSNETSKVNGDTNIYLMPSNQLKGKTVIDVTHPSKHSTLAMKHPEVPNKKASIDVDSSDTPCNPAMSSEDSDQPSASADTKDNCTKSSSRRKRGRPPRKLKAFAPEAFNETPNEKGVVSPCDVHAEGVLGSTYAGHMIPSPSGSLGQNMNDGKEHSNSYSDHNDKDNEPQRASEVTNLKRQREFGNKKSGFGSDADTLEPATVEPPGIIDFPPSSLLRKSRVMLRYDQMKHPNMQSPTRTFVKHRFKDLNEIFNYKEHQNKALGHTLMSGRQQRHCQQSDSLTQGQCDESGEKQMKGKKQLSDHQAVEKAKENKDVETHVLFGCQEDNNNAVLHRIDETAIKSRNNKELPFVKKSHIWEMIESMEVFKRLPQRPHFRPLYEYKEECREGLAIGNMVTFSTLVDKVSRLKLSDPRSLLDGYLEAAVDLERMGFEVGAVRDQLKSLVAIKDRHELTQKTYIEIEGHIRDVHKFSKSIINKEIREVDENIEELAQERSLLEGKKQMKDSAIQLLHAGVDDIKMSLQRAEQEFADVASSRW